MSLDEELTLGGGVLRCRDHPDLRSAIARAVQRGHLTRAVPGVVVVSALADDPAVRLRIAATWRPGDPLSHDAAAHLTITPRPQLPHVVVAGHTTLRRGGFEVQDRRISPEWITLRSGLPVTVPSLTVADQLCIGRCSDLYDGLRRRVVALDSVRAALDANPHRRGTADARRRLWSARENPWSDGEALMHSIFRAGGLQGWKGNVPVQVGARTYFGDCVFARGRLIVELDGRTFHSDETHREADRTRRNHLVAAGWRVLILTMDMLIASPADTVALVRAALAKAHRR